jgi:hypothetical protein
MKGNELMEQRNYKEWHIKEAMMHVIRTAEANKLISLIKPMFGDSKYTLEHGLNYEKHDDPIADIFIEMQQLEIDKNVV